MTTAIGAHIAVANHRRRRDAVDWAPLSGRELGSELLPETPAVPYRIVACLNVWNDRAALERTVRTWYDHVDHVIAVDGEYARADDAIRSSLSTDGTREFLLGLPEAATKLTLVDAAGVTQCEKRTRYFRHGQPGDLCVILDADETVDNAAVLRSAPMLDVGWVRITSALYRTPYGQPRLIRWEPGLYYWGRHHWLYAWSGLVATHQYGGVGVEHRTSPLAITNHRGLGHTTERGLAKRQHARVQIAHERTEQAGPHTAASDATVGRREHLRIAMVALRDDGIAPSRLHTAINRTTPHASLFVCGREGSFGSPSQFVIPRERTHCGRVVATADIVHYHVDIPRESALVLPAPHARQRVVLHHHGSPLRRHAERFARLAEEHSALVLVSNLQLLTYAPTATFLPNAMPVARYRRLRALHDPGPWTDGPFRVAHSPSRPGIKGTEQFLRACERLTARGYPIAPVMMHNRPHCEVLAIKATCHAAFDAFWLGLQCSGLEAAAMGLPVIAGDESVRDRHVERFGSCPYTFADTEEELEGVLAQLMDDTAYRAAETERVSGFVTEYHDESAVALAYLDALDTAFGWRSGLSR